MTKRKSRGCFLTSDLRHPLCLFHNHFPKKQSYANHIIHSLKTRGGSLWPNIILKHFTVHKTHYNLSLVLTFNNFFCYCLTLGFYHSEITLHHNQVTRPFQDFVPLFGPFRLPKKLCLKTLTALARAIFSLFLTCFSPLCS